ncbi:MAG: hypothetical protein LBC37_00560, partial [Zoogloeaceae bacterium]|nr:hypothetical protein [Zoogloeaceae bacterium]
LYVRNGRRPNPAFILGPAFGGACGFLMLALLHASPAWFDDVRQETFSVVREDEKAQYWQGVSSPELAFTLFLSPQERAYTATEPPRTFTIHRGLFGMSAMEREEFHALFRSKAK